MDRQNSEIAQPLTPTANQPVKKTTAEIEQWLASHLSTLLDISLAEVDLDVSFDRYGLDSSAIVSLTQGLGDWMGQELDPTLPFDYSTIAALAEHLGESPSLLTH
ncbi:MAG: acyl carrier protein [Cyanobacteria bacterium P01_E01_bin.6]